nr:hypothetical protein [Rhodoferax sp. BLA1]
MQIATFTAVERLGSLSVYYEVRIAIGATIQEQYIVKMTLCGRRQAPGLQPKWICGVQDTQWTNDMAHARPNSFDLSRPQHPLTFLILGLTLERK